MPVRRLDRRPDVRRNIEVADGEVTADERVDARVVDHERLVAGNDVLAERVRQRRLARRRQRVLKADVALEELRVRADE